MTKQKFFHYVILVGMMTILVNMGSVSAAPYVYKTDSAPSYDNRGTGYTGTPVSKTMTISNGYVNLAHYVSCSFGWFSSCSVSKYVQGFFVQSIYASSWDTYRLDMAASGTFILSGESDAEFMDIAEGDYTLQATVYVYKGSTLYFSEVMHSETDMLGAVPESNAIPISYSKAITFGLTSGTFTIYYYFKLTVSASDSDILPGSSWAEAQFEGYFGSSVLKLYRCNCGE